MSYKLTKPNVPTFEIISDDVLFLTFNEDKTFKDKSKEPQIGTCLIMSPFSVFHKWMTTDIVEILEYVDMNYIKFRTTNTLYELKYIENENTN